MQTSGKSSFTSRPTVDGTTRVAGLGLAATFFLVAASLSCSPGGIDDPGPYISGATAGGSGGMVIGGTGGMGGGGAMPPGGMVSASTMVDGCSKFKTLGEA